MDYNEAVRWMRGERTMADYVPKNPFETYLERVARADAAKVEQAYWVLMGQVVLADASERLALIRKGVVAKIKAGLRERLDARREEGNP